MRKTPLHVTVEVRESSVVELTVGDRVQLERLVPAKHGSVAERHGALLDPGVATLALQPGLYYFKTLSDANLKVVRGGVTASTHVARKDPWPPPPPFVPTGDAPVGETPRLTIE